MGGDDPHPQCMHGNAELHQHSHPAEPAGGGGHQRGRLARQGVAGRTGGPVNGVLQHGGDRMVILGCGDQQPLRFGQGVFQPLGPWWQPLFFFQVAVVKGDRQLFQVNHLHLRPSGLCRLHPHRKQLAVERIPPRAAGHRQNAHRLLLVGRGVAPFLAVAGKPIIQYEIILYENNGESRGFACLRRG